MTKKQSIFVPTEILRRSGEENIGRFAFIEKQTIIAGRKIAAAFSHGLPFLNMGSNYDAYPNEGKENTNTFLERVGFHLPAVLLFGLDGSPVRVTPGWIQKQKQIDGTYETPHNFLWGKVADFHDLTLISKTADCLVGLGVGKDKKGDGYFFFFHGSWRLINMGMLQQGLADMKRNGCDLATMHVSIGPSISEQGLTFQTLDAEKMLDKHLWETNITNPTDEVDDITQKTASFVHLNLGGGAIQQMTQAGISEKNIEWYDPNANLLFDTFSSGMLKNPLLFSNRASTRGQRQGRNITAFSIQEID